MLDASEAPDVGPARRMITAVFGKSRRQAMVEEARRDQTMARMQAWARLMILVGDMNVDGRGSVRVAVSGDRVETTTWGRDEDRIAVTTSAFEAGKTIELMRALWSWSDLAMPNDAVYEARAVKIGLIDAFTLSRHPDLSLPRSIGSLRVSMREGADAATLDVFVVPAVASN